jgi:CubicO group peptidase (beta-lactamase class C family)
MRRTIAAIVAGVVGVGTVTTTVPAAASPAGCGFPKASWTSKAPSSVAMDGTKLQDALDFATQHTSATVLVIRHGCLAGATRLDALTSKVALDGWSLTKSVTALLVGRAVTLGKLDIDRPIARLFPEADRAHGRLTPRHLLTMSSGLHLNWLRDLNPAMPDRVRDALSLASHHVPGTWWEYQQSPVTLLAEAVRRAVRADDLQAWAQAQLFAPVGISASDWTWDRDRAGHTEGWAHLKMVSPAWARLGYLVLRDGTWNGRRLIAGDYMRQMRTSSTANHAYGFLTWLNGRDSYVMPGTNGRDAGTGTLIPTAPRDTLIFAGQNEQRVYVIPSLDIVVVRLGHNGSHDLDFRRSVWTGKSGQLDIELMRRLRLSVTDVRYRDPGAYTGSSFAVPSLEPDSVPGSARDPEQVLAGAGAGPSAPTGCTPAGCS